MNLKKIVLLAFVALIPLQTQAEPLFLKGEDHQTLTTPHFLLHYPESLAPIAADMVDIMERVYDKLTKKFNWEPSGKTQVVLLDTVDSANGLANVVPTNMIHLNMAYPEADSSLDHYKNYLEMLFTHEFTHILHIEQHYKLADPVHWVTGKIAAPNWYTPGWMREGIAAFEESVETGYGRGNASYSEMLLRNSILADKFPKIDEVEGLSYKWPLREAHYIYGVKFFQWLAQKYGEQKIYQYTQLYASGPWLYSLNNKAKRVFGKSFYDLWDEWKNELKVKYGAIKTQLENKGLTPLSTLKADKNTYSYPTPHPKGGMAYQEVSNDDGAKIILDLPAQPRKVIKRPGEGPMAFSKDKDGSSLAFASPAAVEPKKSFREVFIYNIEKSKLERIYDKGFEKKAMRVSQPEFSPLDGGKRWLLMVRTQLSTDNLYLFDLKNKKGYYLTDLPSYTQLSNPRFSPDGQTIAVSIHQPDGYRDIVLFGKDGKKLRAVTNDPAVDNHPNWSASGRALYFESDRSGIANIYEYSLASGETTRITNVLGGVYQPMLTGDSTRLVVREYKAQGIGISSINLSDTEDYEEFPSPHPFKNVSNHASNYEEILKDKTTLPTIPHSKPLESERYSAFPDVLLPRYLIPTFTILEDTSVFGLATGRYDPLFRHAWNAFVNYRSDAKFVGGGANYAYLRYNPIFYTGMVRYALDWGNTFNTGNDFFEDRLQGYVGTALRLKQNTLGLNYFYEFRDNLTTIPPGFPTANLDQSAGLRFTYALSKFKYFPNSISQENGPAFKLNVEWTNSLLGSAEANEQVVITADGRYYLEMPWSDHHVLGFRVAGGAVYGDREFVRADGRAIGSLRFGGPFGEGNNAGYGSRLFPFRGLPGITYAGDRALLATGEYRFPIARIDRGIGTWPIFFNKVYMSLFSDAGTIWNRNTEISLDDLFVSVGSELKTDFMLGYGLPLTLRTGYAIIVTNRDLIQNFIYAPLNSIYITGLESSVKNGTFYIQFGTSF